MWQAVVAWIVIWASIPAVPHFNTAEILQNMHRVYAEVHDYQADILVRRYQEDGSMKVWQFTYTFKKPGMIRIDFRSPHQGLIVVYPGSDGKAIVQPFPRARFFKWHLPPDSDLFKRSGQRLDQTDMGQLIDNIGKSMRTDRLDEPVITDPDGAVEIRVVARDHFDPARLTRYMFRIDRNRWLPEAVDESTPEGVLKREVRFEHLRINLGIADRFFRLDG